MFVFLFRTETGSRIEIVIEVFVYLLSHVYEKTKLQ